MTRSDMGTKNEKHKKTEGAQNNVKGPQSDTK